MMDYTFGIPGPPIFGAVNSYFCVLPVSVDVGRAWSAGRLKDFDLLAAAVAIPIPCPVFLIVLRVDGQAAGIRALFEFLAGLAARHPIAGFAMRTRLRGVERIFERFNGSVSFDEEDGDRRWTAPADPSVRFLAEYARRLRLRRRRNSGPCKDQASG